MNLQRLLLALASLCLSPSLWATTYSYQGPPYTSKIDYTSPCVTGPCANYALGQRITGQFTTAAPLPPNLVGLDVHASVTSYLFTDGVNNYSSSDPNTRFSIFAISTDAAGHIIAASSEVQIQLWQSGSSPHHSGDRGAVFDACSGSCGGQGGDQAVNDFDCTTVQVSGGGGGNIAPDTCASGSPDASGSRARVTAGSTGTWAAAAGVDINQHGLTGSWYEAATSGQGVEVEVFANPASGMGSTFVSWFTYDTAIGGADHQRWYTAQGPVVTGQPSAALMIYQNTGGNFDAPPATNAQPVGTATLSFDTCTSGQLSYNFTDGTGRTGTIALTRLTQNVTCSTTTPYPTNADFALSGNWYGGAATSGQGFTAEVNPNSGAFFATWYTYAPMGATAGAAGQRWYTAQGTAAFTPGMRSIPVTIYETTGGMFDKPTPAGQMTVPVGTGTMAFQSCTAATFSYNFTAGSSMGSSGAINLSRVGPVPPGCTT